MPGIFSWKNRILGRKTPEPERAKQITLPRDSGDRDRDAHTTRRSVRFNEDRNEFSQYNVPDWQNEYGEARVIGSVSSDASSGLEKCDSTPAADWRYADSYYRVTMAPLASSEVIDDDSMLRRIPSGPPNSSRAGSVLQHLREQEEQPEYSEPRRAASTLPPMGCRPVTPVRGPPPQYSGSPAPLPRWDANRGDHIGQLNGEFSSPGRQLEHMNVVFLQANDEVKRAILPPEVHSLDQVKMAFVRAFPNISRHYIEQPSIKIYIQEPSKGQLFYELDDPSDIRNKSVLKLREHSSAGMQSPVRFLDQPDYLSETDNDDSRQRFVSLARPASAMAHADYRKSSRKNFETFDPYGSDTSSHDSRSVTRSGSATPIIDRESRARMETMERQLAGLSSLVHSALVSKGMSESSRRDMADLRREILALHPDAERAASEEPPSIPDSFSSHTQHQLDHLRQKLLQTGTDMKQLRRIAQVNAQNARKYINEAAEEIARLISEKVVVQAPSAKQHEVNGEGAVKKENETSARKAYEDRLIRLLEGLTRFENNVEDVRSSVLTSNRKLRMTEVESLTEGLTQIGREAAALKTEFPAVQSVVEAQIKADMERIVREEKYIRDQTAAVDQSLRRCKALANIMVTMKKLAMVQDPTIQRTKKETGSVASSPTPAQARSPPPPPPPPPPKPDFSGSSPSVASLQVAHSQNFTSSATTPRLTNGFQTNGANSEVAAPFTPNISRNAPELLAPLQQTSLQSSPATELDMVLEEMSTAGIPPRPPSRYSVQDVRQKFQKPPELPEQIKNLMEEVVRRGSPGPEANERRMDLEERQERLAEKQRQLLSQFQQLQQMTPLP